MQHEIGSDGCPRGVAAWLLALGLLAALAGCGSSGGGSGLRTEEIDRGLEAEYPDLQYLWTYGYSPDGYSTAEDHARASIAAYINSEVRQVRSSTFEEITENGRFTTQSVDRDTTFLATSFEHAELVRFDPRGRKRVDGRYRVFGYLERSETGRILLREYDEAAATMKAHAQRALALADGPDLLAFAATVGAGSAAFRQLRSVHGEYRAITGREIPDYSFDWDLWQRVEQARRERLAGLAVALRLLPAADTFDDERLADELEAALQDLGLQPAPADCPDGGYRIDLRPVFTTTGWGPVEAVMTLQGELIDCARDRAVADLYLADPALTGTGPREFAAIQAAAAPAAAPLLSRLLADALGDVLPVR